MTIVSALQRVEKTFPGWDCRFAPCKHEKTGDHGIHSDEFHLAVIAELSDGRRAALVLTIVSGKYPDTVPASWLSNPVRPYPWATDLTLHVQAKEGRACCWFGERGKCEVAATTAHGASQLFENRYELGIDGRREAEQRAADLWKFVGGPDEALWMRLERRFRELVNEYERETLAAVGTP